MPEKYEEPVPPPLRRTASKAAGRDGVTKTDKDICSGSFA